jgi:hypothetical protein
MAWQFLDEEFLTLNSRLIASSGFFEDRGTSFHDGWPPRQQKQTKTTLRLWVALLCLATLPNRGSRPGYQLSA